jgi:Flp pilus assembly protein CpaB
VVGAILAVVAFATAAALASLPLLQGATGGTRVVVASHDIKARTVIQASDLMLLNYSPAPPQAFLAIKDVAGKGARVDIPANAAVTANQVAPSGDLLSSSDNTYLPIPSGYVAVTVPTSEQVGVGGYIQSGDRITMLATVNTSVFGQSPGVPVVRTVFRDLDVIRVGPANTQAAPNSVTSSLTLLMTSCDSEFLFWMLTNATLKYELEAFKDYAATPQSADPACPTLSSAAGVGPRQVNDRWTFTKT